MLRRLGGGWTSPPRADEIDALRKLGAVLSAVQPADQLLVLRQFGARWTSLRPNELEMLKQLGAGWTSPLRSREMHMLRKLGAGLKKREGKGTGLKRKVKPIEAPPTTLPIPTTPPEKRKMPKRRPRVIRGKAGPDQ
jgi:hypothetical protein